MKKFDLTNSVRKNILIPQRLYEQTLELAQNLDLKYPDYIRFLLEQEVRNKVNPPANEPYNLPKDFFGPNYMGSRNREDLIKIMNSIRKLL